MQTIEKYCANGQGQEISLCTNANQVTTLATIAKEEYPLSITRAVKEQGIELVAKHVVEKINEYLDIVNLQNSMNTKQVIYAAQLIVEKHPHLPIKSLDVFFKECIVGAYGPHYNRMDIPTLMQWLQKFENDYFDMVEEQAYAEHQSTKGDKGINLMAIIESKEKGEEPAPMPDSIKKMLHLKREVTLEDEIRARVIRENSHLFSTMDADKAQAYIVGLINNELIEHGIFNLD